MDNKSFITVQVTVNAAIEKVWACWTRPENITKWNFASDDWHSPSAQNDLVPGGRFLWRMEAKDGSFGFDFSGVYDEVILHEYISYTLDDGRIVQITFKPDGNNTEVAEVFEAEAENSLELQQSGWQAILNNFKKYAEQAGD